MKKLFIFIFLLSSIVIVWCGGIKSNDFENKTKCFSLQNEWEKDYFANSTCAQQHYVMEVIYSKKHNSCLAYYSCGNGDYVIRDMFSKKELCYKNINYNVEGEEGREGMERENIFSQCYKENRK